MKHLTRGAVHIHTKYSDGTGTIEEIARDAKKAGLDWIIITDHNTLAGLKNGEEGWYNGVAVIVGNEISPKDCNHYLAIGITEELPDNLSPEEYIKEVKTQGGIGFVAHPDESRIRRNNFPPLRWCDWSMRGFDGIELWNYLSDWTDNYDAALTPLHVLARNFIVQGPSEEVRSWWDEMNRETEEIVPAIGGLDSHCFKFGPLRIFPYYSSFKTLTNYLYLDEELSADFEQAKSQVLGALKAGNNIIVNRVLNRKDDSKLRFYIEGRELYIHLPQKADIKVYRNGNLMLDWYGNYLEDDELKPGKYRFEAYYKGRPWIFSNPIAV